MLPYILTQEQLANRKNMRVVKEADTHLIIRGTRETARWEKVYFNNAPEYVLVKTRDIRRR